MLVATVVSMWALSAMAVTVRHGRSRLARWAQQQHNELQPQPPSSTKTATAVVAMVAVTAGDHLHDPGGGSPRSSPPPPLSGNGHQQHHRDKANVLLRIVESQQQLGGNCTAGTDLNMGEGVVDRYAQVRAPASRPITFCYFIRRSTNTFFFFGLKT
jgi:hypothetical protein